MNKRRRFMEAVNLVFIGVMMVYFANGADNDIIAIIGGLGGAFFFIIGLCWYPYHLAEAEGRE